jgi:hypothetical protein
MAVSDMIAEAWKAVKDAGVPEALHEVAFKEAMAVLTAGSSRTTAKPAPAGAAGSGSTTPRPKAKPRVKREPVDTEVLGTVLPDDDLFDKFSTETGIPRQELEEVFYFDGGKPILNGPARQLGSNLAAQARTVAIAITAAYHYALDVRDVPASKIADECKRLKCWDTDNFSSYMAKEKAVNFIGPRGKKVFRIKQPDTVEALKLTVNLIRGVQG